MYELSEILGYFGPGVTHEMSLVDVRSLRSSMELVGDPWVAYG